MKQVSSILLVLILTGCGGAAPSADALITVDVTKKYPQKELILSDIMDVEYVALETTDEFVCQGEVRAVGKNVIVVMNQSNDGNIYIFDRNGKGLKKINRMGNSGEEYTYLYGITLDEDNNVIFVEDMRQVLVYDLQGKFVRTFQKWWERGNPYRYDREHWIGKLATSNTDNKDANNSQFAIKSKQGENTVKDFSIHFEQKIEARIMVVRGDVSFGAGIAYSPLVPYYGSWILAEPSSDTLFRLSPDYTLMPLVARTPSVQSMDPVVFLFPKIFTERYYFMETVKREGDVERRIGMFPKTHLVYDKQEGSMYEYAMYNDDFSVKKPITLSREVLNSEIALWQKYEALDLVDALEKGELKGKLKDIAATLDEESNPVIMLGKYKK